MNENLEKFESNIWKMYLIKFFSGLHFIGGVLIPFFAGWGQLSMTQILFLQSWFIFWVFFLEVPTGTVADYWGRKHSLVLAGFSLAIGALVYVLYSNFYLFLLGEFLWAVGAALTSGADQAIIYESLKQTNNLDINKKVFARLQSAKMLGLLVAAPIGSFIGATLGVRYAMGFMFIPFLLSALVALFIYEPRLKIVSESQRYLDILVTGFKYFKNHQVLKILAFDFVSIAIIGYFIIWLYQVKLTEVGLPIVYFGIIHALMVLGQIIFMNNFSFFESFFKSKKRVLMIGGLISGFFYLLAAFTNLWMVVATWAIIGATFALGRQPLFFSYFNAQIPDDSQRATVLSFIGMTQKFVLIFLNPLVGCLTDWSLSYTMLSLGVLAIVFSFISRVKEEHLIA